MINRIVKGVLESYGVDQKMVDKIKSIVDNIGIEESEDEITVSVDLKKVQIIIRKDKAEQ